MAKGARKSTRNPELGRGINRFGRAASDKKRRVYLHTKKTTAPKAVVVAPTKEPRWYSADDVKKPLTSRKSHHKPARLRKSITPGTVLILLAGRFKGKRVVFLKQLASGLLLISGPFKVNGVPVRRVNQAYVIATSTKVDVSKVDVASVDDVFFARAKAEKKKNADGEFFEEEKKTKIVTDVRKALQKKVDGALMKEVVKTPMLKHYLNAKFSLTNGQKVHDMKF